MNFRAPRTLCAWETDEYKQPRGSPRTPTRGVAQQPTIRRPLTPLAPAGQIFSLDNNAKKRPRTPESAESEAKRAKREFDFRGGKLILTPFEFAPSEMAKATLADMMDRVTWDLMKTFTEQHAQALDKLRRDMHTVILNNVVKDKYKGKDYRETLY